METLFKIKNVKLESIIDDNDMISFDVVTKRGTENFSEYLNKDDDGGIFGLEETDSNIKTNCHLEIESLFDMDIELVPYNEIFKAVEEQISSLL